MMIDDIKLRASITVEAAFSFTITVFVLFMMLGPLLVIKTTSDFIIEQNEISKIRCNYEMLKYRSKDTEIYRKIDNYIKDNEVLSDNFDKIEDISNYIGIYASFVNKYDDSKSEYRNINFIYDMNQRVYDEETSVVRLDYFVDFNLPYNVLHVRNVNNRLVSSRRAFVGADGDRFNKEYLDGDYVFIANNYVNSSVYHANINCTYLVKQTKSVEHNNISEHRNYENKKYTKCDYCFKKIKIHDDTICYITQYGDRYHYRSDCPLMTAYVTKLNKEFIEKYNLRPCFKCAKEEE